MLKTEEQAQSARLVAMHNLVPHFILENFAQGNHRGHFPAVGLFVDITGFTQMTEALMKHGPHGAEVLAEIMRSVFDSFIRSIYEYGGFVIGLAGDAFMSLFPIEPNGEDACRRSLAAAWQIHTYNADHSVYGTPYGNFSISVKEGLASGEVNWGIVLSEDERRAVFFFQGTAVEGCSECEHLAAAGEIILEKNILRQVKELVAIEPVDDHYRLAVVQGQLPAAQAVELPTFDTSMQTLFFPPEVVHHAHLGEFRQVASAFISLPTIRTEAQLEIFMGTLFDLQNRYGGLLNRLDFGDKGSHLVLLWGAPVAEENDIERALNFVLDLQTQTSIPIHAGVTYQISYAGFVGSPLREEFTSYGEGPNLAARFMTAAPRGEIWIDERVAQQAQPKFEIEYMGERSFKGFAENQRVYSLLERKQKTEGLFQKKLIGRESELRQLAAFINPLTESKYAGALVIRGEAGIGKSHLAHKFMNSTSSESRGILWAVCQVDDILRRPLNPFHYWLRNYFDVFESQVEARNKRNFNRKLDILISTTSDENLATELDRIRSFLGSLLGLYWPDSLYEQLDAEGRYENTMIGLAALLQAESFLQPVALLLEDAHWLDVDSCQFLPRLARRLVADESKSYPVAIIATARPEKSEDVLGEGLEYQEINLSQMQSQDVARLAEMLLEGRASPELLDLLIERAEGNPFFTEQILIYLQDEDILEQGQYGWTIRASSTQLLPATVRAVLVARLDRLVQEVKEVVQTAAVMGREFEVQLLVHMFRHDEELPQRVAMAEKAAIWTRLSELRYLFNHALLRDAAYRMQAHARRQTLHALLVEAMENVYSADLGPHYGELAYHAEKGILVEKARHYLQLAGDASAGAFQNSQAVDYYSRALALTPPDEIDALFTLHRAREKVYELFAAHEARDRELMTLNHLVERTSPGLIKARRQAEVALRQAKFAYDITDRSSAILAAEQAVAIANEARAPEIAVKAYNLLSGGLQGVGKMSAAVRLVEAGLAIAREIGDLYGESLLLNRLGIICQEQNKTTAARVYLEQSLQIARKLSDRQAEAKPLNNLGNAAGSEGDYSAAKGYYEQVLQISHEVGDKRMEGVIFTNLGWLSGMLGDYSAARDYTMQGLRANREVGYRETEMISLVNLSSWALAQQDEAAALDYARQSLNLSLASQDRSGEAWALTYLGHARLGISQLGEAREAYQAALNIRREMDQLVLSMEPLAGLAQVALLQGQLEEAQATLEPILTHLKQGGSLEGAEEPLRVLWTCYQVLKSAHDPHAGKILETAFNLLQSRAAQISDEATRNAFVQEIPFHREIIAAWTT